MAAPKGNRFYLLRTKSGRDRIIQDPESLERDANEYFEWCEQNPIYSTEIFNTKAGIEFVEKPLRRPFQKGALSLALGLSEWSVINDLKTINKDFFQVITRIENIIYSQKYEGAAIGQFNSNIIARDLGLTEKTNTTIELPDELPKIIRVMIETPQ